MKFHLLMLFFLLHSSTMFSKRPSRPPKPQKPGRTENARIVVGNLAQIIGQIGYIVENPHNADNVGNSVSHIVDNIISITVNALQNKTISIADADLILKELSLLCKDNNSYLLQHIKNKKRNGIM